MPTYNRARFIAEALESVFGQTHAPTQVIVINDGSTDGTKAALRPFFSRIEYVECENGGKPAALNRAMSRVSSEYVWIMDDDDVALPDALSRHLSILEREPKLGWTYSNYIESTSRPETNRIAPEREIALPQFPESEFLMRLMEECFLIHPTILVRASCYRKLGPFRTDLIRSQDYEMAIRLGSHYRCKRIPGPTIYHRLDSGKRGSAADRFDVHDAADRWLKYDLKIFCDLREKLPLQTYVPWDFDLNGDGRKGERRAYFHRMVVMGKKGLVREMIEDLKNALACNPREPLSSVEAEIVRRLASPLSRDPLLYPGNLEAICAACNGAAGRSLRTELAQAMLWRAATGRRNQDYHEVFHTLWAAFRLFELRTSAMNAFSGMFSRVLAPTVERQRHNS